MEYNKTHGKQQQHARHDTWEAQMKEMKAKAKEAAAEAKKSFYEGMKDLKDRFD